MEILAKILNSKMPWLSKLWKHSRYFILISLMFCILIAIYISKYEIDSIYGILVVSILSLLLILSLTFSFIIINNAEKRSAEIKFEYILKSINPIVKQFETVKVLSLDSTDASDHSDEINKAKANVLRGEYKLAIDRLIILSNRESDNPKVFSNLSYAYEKYGDLKAALENINKAIEIVERHDDKASIGKYNFHKARYLSKLAKNNDHYQQEAMKSFKIACDVNSDYLYRARVTDGYDSILKNFR